MRAVKYAMRAAAYRLFPDVALKIDSARSRRFIEAQVKNLGLDDLARRVSRATGSKIAKGPFAGVKLDYDLLPVHGAPKFLGTYEQELHPYIEQAIARMPQSILNVGCAEGFYGVGFAVRVPNAIVYIADADAKAERSTLLNAGINKVRRRVCATGIIKPGDFSNYLAVRPSLVMMDCEGAEFVLLDPAADPVLQHSDIIVEVHPEFGTADQIAARFVKTHVVNEVQPTARTIADAPTLTGIAANDLLQAMDERSGVKSWLCMFAR